MCLKLQGQKNYLRFTILVINFNQNSSWHRLLTFWEDVSMLLKKNSSPLPQGLCFKPIFQAYAQANDIKNM